MFTADDIQARLKQQPFLPLKIVTSGGHEYEIQHPDLVLVGRRDLTIGTASNVNPAQYETTTRVAIMHVTAMEDLPLPAKPETNGQ